MSETLVVTKTSWSRPTVTIASILFLLVLLPAHSQIPTPSGTPFQRTNSRVIRINPPPAGGAASPTNRPRPRFPGNTLSPNVPRRPKPTVTPSVPPIRQIVATMSKLASAATLRAHPPSIDVGQKVQLELVFPQPPPASSYIRYGFDFDDNSGMQWAVEPWAVHPYDSPGTHHASAVIRVGETVLSRNIFRADIEVRPRSSPTPSATASIPITPSPNFPSRTAIAPGGLITVTPIGSSPDVASPTATRSASKPGIMTPSPTVSDGMPPSENTSRFYYIIGVAIGVASLAYLVYSRSKQKVAMAARPTFHPHADWDAPQKPSENLMINYELHFHSNISSGQNWLETHGQTLILRKTIQ